ncbi:hypothetical protein [Carnobacterium maltaromaticum]|uniref:hypothetical protein n=1 Tax=Carnobacterium maltaromaticum TaxID=2751 RepID=UPI0039AEB799
MTNFEEDLNALKEGFARNYSLASRKFKTASMKSTKPSLIYKKTKMLFFLPRITCV